MPGLLEVIGYLGLVFGVVMSINTGRRLAQRRHDAELVARYGRRLPGVGLVLYAYMTLAFILNVFSVLLFQVFASEAKLLLAVLTGSLASFVAGVVMTIVLIAGSYYFFRKRYEGVDRPLTREGRLALRGVDLGARAAEGAQGLLRRRRGE